MEYISLKGTSKEAPAVCKYTGLKYYSEARAWSHALTVLEFASSHALCSCWPCNCHGRSLLPSLSATSAVIEA